MNSKIKRLVALAGLAATASVLVASGYQKTKTVALTGPTSWDYVTVEANTGRVYIANSTQVQVLDADTLAMRGMVPGIAGAHGFTTQHRSESLR